ncbi:UNVERIFIED_CONTAM: hypothetical protein Slati_0093800 [Sesamum latifolium]|uniref:Uncharacterized protein n=1 Tax=Sesamum latifolium TaxID=2727402 RepID=A0AAW2Y898_9LAMI
MLSKTYGYENNTGQKNTLRRKGPQDKRHLVCEYCHKAGHNKDTYFRLHGVPEWYKELNEQKKRGGNGGRAYIALKGITLWISHYCSCTRN